MQNINKTILVGHVCHDVGERDFAYLGNGDKGVAKLNFTIAVNDYKKVNGNYDNIAYFFDVTSWGKNAEYLKNAIKKGTFVVVEGKLVQDRWEKDGQKFSKVYVSADKVEVGMGGKEKPTTTESANAQQPLDDFPEDPVF